VFVLCNKQVEKLVLQSSIIGCLQQKCKFFQCMPYLSSTWCARYLWNWQTQWIM